MEKISDIIDFIVKLNIEKIMLSNLETYADNNNLVLLPKCEYQKLKNNSQMNDDKIKKEAENQLIHQTEKLNIQMKYEIELSKCKMQNELNKYIISIESKDTEISLLKKIIDEKTPNITPKRLHSSDNLSRVSLQSGKEVNVLNKT